MHKYVKELLGGSLIYGLSGMISSAMMLFLVPIYTRVFTPADYGVLNLINITYFLLTIFVIFGLDNSAALWFWDKTEDEERKKTFASWAYFSLAFSSAVAVLILLFSQTIIGFTAQRRAICSAFEFDGNCAGFCLFAEDYEYLVSGAEKAGVGDDLCFDGEFDDHRFEHFAGR